ncbi:MAG TPA: nucleoside recognition domain-containing protein, partial [Syntrophobacteraceae bacterium]|nr:nucleoside recognition domain-containing protein [Syntrophobacteraceae bacterium]
GGCAVPGVMATRTLRSSRERMATILTVPFMNCGAKLPVFALLVAAFFPDGQAWMMLFITILSWGGALLAARLLRSTLFKGPATPFLLELPPYRLPTFHGLLIHTWERTWMYLKKAGTVILAISILLWAMMTFPELPEASRQQFEQQRESLLAEVQEDVKALVEAEPIEGEPGPVGDLRRQLREVNAEEAQAALKHSLAGRMGVALEPLGSLCGFDWRTNVALVGGFAAKEVVVSTLGTAFSLGEVDPEESTSLSDHLAADPRWNPLVALSLIVFTIFYAPCFVSVVCIVKEAGSWKWGLFSLAFNTVLAFGAAAAVFQIGSLLGFGVKTL